MARKTYETSEPPPPKVVQERDGNRFRVVHLASGTKVIPLAETPIEGLRSALDGLRDVPLDEIEAVPERRGRREAGVEQ